MCWCFCVKSPLGDLGVVCSLRMYAMCPNIKLLNFGTFFAAFSFFSFRTATIAAAAAQIVDKIVSVCAKKSVFLQVKVRLR